MRRKLRRKEYTTRLNAYFIAKRKPRSRADASAKCPFSPVSQALRHVTETADGPIEHREIHKNINKKRIQNSRNNATSIDTSSTSDVLIEKKNSGSWNDSHQSRRGFRELASI